jgi:DNA mismatch repair ATPase MutS
MNLYEINSNLEELLMSSVDEDGVIKDEFEGKLDELFAVRDDKMLNCAKYIKNQSAFADAIKKEADSLTSRLKSVNNRIEWMKKYILSNVEAGYKVKDSQAEISTRKSSSVKITDQVLIPEEFLNETPATYSPDKKAIKAALKNGDVLGAKMVDNVNLSIK